MAIKRIPLASLKLGMYLVGLDRSWLLSPFLKHRFLIESPSQVDKLKQIGAQFVDIDTSKGADVGVAADVTPVQADTTLSPEEPAGNDPVHPRADLPHAVLERVMQEPSLKGTSMVVEFSEARDIREQMLGSVRDLLSSVRTSGVVESAGVKEATEEIITTTLAHDQSIIALIRTREFNPELYDHALSVSTFAVVLGRLMGYDPARLRIVAMAGMVHDVGLLRMPQNLMRLTRAMSTSERKLYESHPMIGLEVLKKSGGFPDEVLQIVANHHLKPDKGKAGTEHSRLVQVSDVYDELLTGQGDRPPLPVRDALRLLYREGQENRVDLELAAHLITQIGIYPLYSFVELNTGHRGIVTAVKPGDLLKPVVLLTHGPDRRPYDEPIAVNLAAGQSESAPLEIVSILDPEKEKVNIEEMLADWVAH